MQLFTLGANGLTLSKLNKLLWTIAESAAAVGNVGTGEDDLIALTVPAGTLAVDGDAVQYRAGGVLAANGNTKTIKFKYAGTSLGTNLYSATGSGLGWHIDFRITRTGATAAVISGLFIIGNTISTFATTVTITWANAVELKLTGEGTSSNDVVQHMGAIVGIPGV